MVDAARGELILDVVDNAGGVEVSEDGQQTSPVPVVSHTAAVITLTCQVRDGVVRQILVFVDKHLRSS